MIEGLPPPALERALLRRATLVSLLLHLAVAVAYGATDRPLASAFRLRAPAMLLLWLAVFLVVRLTLRKAELRLLSDLAVSWVGVAAVTVAAFAAVELSLGLAALILLP
jgi:hypothetical protein